MSWKKSKLSTPIPEAVGNLASGLSTIVSTVVPIINIVTTLLSIVKVFLTDVVDPFKSLVDAILEELETFINDFFATGFYLLIINPFEIRNVSTAKSIINQQQALMAEERALAEKYQKQEKDLLIAQSNPDISPQQYENYSTQLDQLQTRKINQKALLTNKRALLADQLDQIGVDSFGIPKLSPRQAILAAVESLDDLGDPNRPQFSDNAQVCALGIMATAPGLDQFKALIELLLQVFEIPEWRIALLKFNEVSTTGTTASAFPDWKSVRLNSFTPMDDIQSAILDVIHTVQGYQVVADDCIQDLIDILDQKAALLEELAKRLEDLANALKSATGLFVLNVPIGVGGNSRLKTEFRDSILECAPNDYTIAAIFVGGGPSLQDVDNLRKLMTGG
jgi:hypothetical protein